MAQPKHPESFVVLGMHADDALSVYVRDDNDELHQAARIATHNGVTPLLMTKVMADLADTFGWRQIATAPSEVPQPEPPARVLPTPTREVRSAAAGRASTHPAGKRRHTRHHDLTIEQIIEFVHQHPEGVRAKQIAETLAPDDPYNRHTVSNRLIAYRDKVAKGKVTARLMVVSDGHIATIHPVTPP